ncbi:hypothetical protein M9H77_30312 [Catharanthus roseus]|uniref:Uncharacterized protein n=1 Tax=Catharanthus roseus TaxID=4058 RepID=A0ACB9ZWW3_CATRO|nr:hypothetical protein M9H77_30312 [Catharanthus roseus]
MDGRFHKRRGGYEEYYDSYYHGGFICAKSSQTLGTTSRPLNYYIFRKAWEREMESVFYSYGVREEEKFQLMLKYFSYVLNDWWGCDCEYRRRMGIKPIKTWSLMKKALKIRYGVKNHEGQGQGQAKVKLESSMVEESLKTHAMEDKKRVEQGSFDEELSITESIPTSLEEWKCKKSVVSTKESEGKTEGSALLDVLILRNNFWIELLKKLFHDLELLHDNLFIDLIVSYLLCFGAFMWTKIDIFLGSFVESGYVERASWLSFYLCDNLHVKYMGKFVKECGYFAIFSGYFCEESSSFYSSKQTFALCG